MNFEKHIEDSHVEIKPEGRIDIAVAKEFEQIMLSLMNKEQAMIILNFINTAYISSAGLRVILTASKEAKLKEKTLCLCGVNASVQKVLDKSGFSSFLDIHDSISDVLK